MGRDGLAKSNEDNMRQICYNQNVLIVFVIVSICKDHPYSVLCEGGDIHAK